MRPQPMQQETLQQRLPVVIIGLLVVSIILLGRLMSFQFQLDPRVLPTRLPIKLILADDKSTPDQGPPPRVLLRSHFDAAVGGGARQHL